ncbi:hypothetical protein CBS101457_001668 [Exobasidium rhododendri]|nr:hypothetical protein CBS101457_001668 [Exobasidium rhododendri]
MASSCESDAAKGVQEFQTYSQKRKEARRLKDPHSALPFRRFFIGPSPVRSHVAHKIAQAIAEDVTIDKPTAIGITGKDGTFIVGRPSFESPVRPTFVTDTNRRRDEVDASPTSPTRRRQGLSPTRSLNGSKISGYSDRLKFQRQLSREASFLSAKSKQDSILDEAAREESLGTGSSPPKVTSSVADLRHAGSFSSLVDSPTTTGKGIRRRESQSSYEPSQQLGRKKLSFDVLAPRDRRGRSEGATRVAGSILQKSNVPFSQEADMMPSGRRLLGVPLNERGSDHGEITSTSPLNRNGLRYSSSQQSFLDSSSSPVKSTAAEKRLSDIHGLPVLSPSRDASSDVNMVKGSSVDPDADGSQNLDVSESAQRQRLRERARKRHQQSQLGKAGGPSRTTTAHSRDISRQSRLSRASTAGTFASIGTRFSEGTFGATGGVRSRIFGTFGRKNIKAIEARARDLKLEHKRHGGRSIGKGGVIPGAVGTSAGGTKWVGQTFEVGKRFWQVVESREEGLDDDVIQEEEEEAAAAKGNADVLERNTTVNGAHTAQLRNPSRQSTANQTTETVIDNFARKAQELNVEREILQSPKLTHDSKPVKQRPTTPALTFTGSDSDNSRKGPHTPPKEHAALDLLGKPVEPVKMERTLTKESSQASFISISHDQGPIHESAFDIESRHGWSDVVSFMSAKTIAKNRKSASQGRNTPSKKLFESNPGLQDSRTRADGKVKQDAIEESSNETFSTTSEDFRADATNGKVVAKMSVKEALTHPEAPLSAEERFPLATYELLRRPSNPGVRPVNLRDDAASDHEVIARPTRTESPEILSTSEASLRYRWDNDQSSVSNRQRTVSTASVNARLTGSPTTSATPLLSRAISAIDLRSNAISPFMTRQSEMNEPGMLSILQGEAVPNPNHQQKKNVQFQTSNGRLTPILGRNLGTALFNRNSPVSEREGMTLLAGRAKNVTSGDAAPAPPQEVLSRNATPDGLASPRYFDNLSSTKNDLMVVKQTVLKRDRMLVKLAWTPSEDLAKDFNERESRKHPMYSDPFKEVMVVYRTGRLELWEDPSVVSKYTGHGDQLKLHAVTSLKRGKTFISMFSPIDRIFCLTFAKHEDHHHRLLHLRRSGTCIWIFDARSMTISNDWIWELSRELGLEIPDHLDVYLPALGVRVRIPVPEEMPAAAAAAATTADGGRSIVSGTTSNLEVGEGFKLISRDYVKRVVRKVVEAQTEWRQLCQSVEVSGLQFELAWRNESSLNWVIEDYTSDGQKRDWAVLVGTMLSEFKRPSVLEYRPATHFSSNVRLPKGEKLEEPPGIEGFLWRVKAVSGALTRIYITTYDGLLFVNRTSKAFPPDRHLAANVNESNQAIDSQYGTDADMDQNDRERRRKRDAVLGKKRNMSKVEGLAELRKRVLASISVPAVSEEEIDVQIEAYKDFEKRRQFEQVNNADGYVDVRDIVLIRSMDENGLVRRPGTEDTAATEVSVKSSAHEEGQGGSDNGDEEDEEDLGGEEGLLLAKDRALLKKNRQLEVTLNNGRSIRFEAYSKSVAREYIERLADVCRYWKRREKVDALDLMAASGLDPSLVGRQVHKQKTYSNLHQSTDEEQAAFTLGRVWNWCVYHSCRGILRSGRLFQKKKAYAGFSSRYYILIAGRLLHYKLMTSTQTARARQNSGIFHKRQETVVHLRDAYVYSGRLTEEMLVNGRSEGAGAINTFGRGTGGASSASSRHTLPRVYGDGLISVDTDEDCTFVIRYRPQRVHQATGPQVNIGGRESTFEHDTTTSHCSTSIPSLGDSTYNHLVLRSRCKIERDLWIRAINVEIERLSREDSAREVKIRETGKAPYKS